MADTNNSYFDPKDFVKRVMEDSNLTNINPKIREQLEDSIEQTLKDRVLASVVREFGEREFGLFAKLLEDHPEMDEMDAIAVIMPNIPGLNDKLHKCVLDLYDELTSKSAMIEQAMAEGKAQKAA